MPKNNYFPPTIQQYLDQGWERDPVIAFLNAPLTAKTDLTIMRKIIAVMGREFKLINEIYFEERRSMPDEAFNAAYCESWIKWLEGQSISRHAFKKAEINGIGPDMATVIKVIFPNVEHYDPMHDEDQEDVSAEPPPPLPKPKGIAPGQEKKGGLFHRMFKRIKGG